MARCCHLVGGHPATLGDGDAVTDDVVEMRDGVGIGVDREDDAMLAGAAHEFVAQVQPVREVADFPGGIVRAAAANTASTSKSRADDDRGAGWSDGQ